MKNGVERFFPMTNLILPMKALTGCSNPTQKCHFDGLKLKVIRMHMFIVRRKVSTNLKWMI